MSDHMKIWDSLKTPPDSALKDITGGRLVGKKDINPQWRYQALTERFGPCGFGWGFSIVKLWTEQGQGGEVMAFANIDLWYGSENKMGKTSIPGIGGSMLVVKEKNGLHCNDEAFKMAVTDALGTAAKMIGLAADVYLGQFDTKYMAPVSHGSGIKRANAPQPENQGMLEITATITKVEQAPNPTSKGTAYYYVHYKDENGNESRVTTFDEKDYLSVKGKEGQLATLVIEQKGKYKNFVAIKETAPSNEAQPSDDLPF